MTTYTKFKLCKVMFAQCSGKSVISSCTVCITLLNSEDVTTMSSISIYITNLGSSWYHWMLLCLAFLIFFSLPTSVPTLHHGFIHAYHTPTVIISDPTESRSRNRAHDCRIAPKVAAVAWYFSPRVVLNAFLNLLFLFCFSYTVNNGSEYA